MNTVYTINNGVLKITDRTSEKVLWQGKPDGIPVQRAETIDNSEDGVVLLDFAYPSAPNRFANLLRCDNKGSILWRAELPTSTSDAYTDFEWQGQKLLAFSWSGFAVTLDIENGRLMSKTFSK